MYQQPTAAQPTGVVLENAIALYRAALRSCWVVSLIGSVLLATSDRYLAAQTGSISVTDSPSVQDALRVLASYGSAGAIRSYIATIMAMLIIYSALLAQMHHIAQGEMAYSPVDALLVALRRIPSAILAAMIFTIAIGCTLLLSVAPALWLREKPSWWWLAVLVALLLLTLSTYLWGKLQFWIVAMFADDVGAVESLGRSWNVTQGNWWRSNTILSIALTVVAVLDLLADLIISLCAGGAVLTAQILRAVVQVLVLPMLPATLLAIYYDLRLRAQARA